ncbi:putative nuclease HARBI1 [Crassostrea angulata]|uniref:putative nuclease HARBI1 n=1 Tax=Magallana angulata TaxID=2784310 RepID=UPI0022B0B161|nr:putative nuclease HARBI1 [Crassostrea angulata]
MHGISLSSASRIIHIVCSALCLCLDNIRFPTSQQELKKVKDEFFNIQGFPNVVGAIDGTLVPIQGMAGSAHDSFILAYSFLPQIMRGVNGWFLGDSGYPLKKWLLTPFAQPSNQQEQRYNSSHCSTRNTVERAFGVLKSRFRCLHKTGGSLQFKTEKCIKFIECCFSLHNKAISERVPLQAGNNAVPVYHNHDL